MAQYADIIDVRNFTHTQSSEFADASITLMIETAMGWLDAETNRTWEKIKSKTENLDGTGTNDIYVNYLDLYSLTSLSIATGNDTAYTTVTTTKVKLYSFGKVVLVGELDVEVETFSIGNQNVAIAYKYGPSVEDTGTGTGTLNTLTDGTKTWATNQWANYFVQDASGATYEIVSNTGTALTIVGTPTTGVYYIFKIPNNVKYITLLKIANMMKFEEAREREIAQLLGQLRSRRLTVYP